MADGWNVKDVRMGPPAEEKKSTRSSPKKKAEEKKDFEQRDRFAQVGSARREGYLGRLDLNGSLARQLG